MKFCLLILGVLLLTTQMVVGDTIIRDVEFTIAPCSGPDVHKIVSYLAFMRMPPSEYHIHYMNAVAEIPANETHFLIKDIPAGDYCFTVVGMLDDGRYSKPSAEGCIDHTDFLFGKITLNLKV